MEANLLLGNTDREIPLIIATSMILYNKYGVDMNETLQKIKAAAGKSTKCYCVSG